MFRSFHKTVRFIVYSLLILPSLLLLLASSPASEQRPIKEDKKWGIEHFKRSFLEETDEASRDEILYAMYFYDDVGAFETLFDAMMSDSGVVQLTAVKLISHYYVVIPILSDDSVSGNKFPEHIQSMYATVINHLSHLFEDTKYIDLKISAIRSLIRMGAASERALEDLFCIATDQNRDSWKYACRACWARRKNKEELALHVQKDAIGLIIKMKRCNLFEEKAKKYLEIILNNLDSEPWLFERFEKTIRKEIGLKYQQELENTSPSYADTWKGYLSAQYAETWCGSGRNHDEGKDCSPFNVYDSDCANFASQCLWAGGLIAAYSYGTEICVPDECCIYSAAALKAYLESRTDKVVWNSTPDISNHPYPNLNIPGYFAPGDIAILQRNRAPYSGRLHAIISSGDASGPQTLFSAHTGDRCNEDLAFFIGIKDGEFQIAHFYHIIGTNTDATVKQFYVVNGTAKWIISSEFRTRGYIIEGSDSSNGPWTPRT